MVLGFSRDVVAAEGESRVSRPSLRCIRSRCAFMLLSVTSMSSLLPGFQNLSRLYPSREEDVTVQHVTSHFTFHCTLLHSGAPGWITRRTSKMGIGQYCHSRLCVPVRGSSCPAHLDRDQGHLHRPYHQCHSRLAAR